MSHDVYAGDVSTGHPLKPRRWRLTVRADADSDVLLRIAVALGCINEAPRELHLTREAEGVVLVDVVIDAPTSSLAENVRRKLLQLSCVLDVAAVAVP